MSEEEKSEEKTSQAKGESSSKTTLFVLVGCIIASAIGLAFFLKGNPGGKIDTPPKNGAEGQGNLVDGKEYMIYINKIEVAPTKSDGKPWDAKGSAPDVYYELTWRNNKIYESEAKKDSLIANWVPVGVDLKESILKGTVTVDQAVKLPIVKRDSKDESSDELIFKIIDDDVVGDDTIEVLRVYIHKLNLGDNLFTFEGKEGHGIVKAVVRVIDNSLSTNEKIELLMGGG